MYSKITVTRSCFPISWCNEVNQHMMSTVVPNPRLGKDGVRKCTVRSLAQGNSIYNEVFNIMMGYVKKHSIPLGVDIDGTIDSSIQHITYYPGDRVGWHNDTKTVSHAIGDKHSLKVNRKLSMTLMLSDPTDYTGGEFLFDPNIKLPVGTLTAIDKGTALLFTSHSPHAVSPILTGQRNIFFIFCNGPEWR